MKRKTTEEFIIAAKFTHGERYDYSETKYYNCRNKVHIICPEHGGFYQDPRSHIRGNGCPKCGSISTGSKLRLTYEDFKKKAIDIHGNKYDYSKVSFSNNKDKISIFCKKHGLFEQELNSHLMGHGCPECSNSLKGYNYSNWEESGNNSKAFESYKVYILKCWDENELFYKIGKTYTSIYERFRNNCNFKMPYNYEVIHIIEGSAKSISELEIELHNMNRDYKYNPFIKFAGDTECFSEYKMKVF